MLNPRDPSLRLNPRDTSLRAGAPREPLRLRARRRAAARAPSGRPRALLRAARLRPDARTPGSPALARTARAPGAPSVRFEIQSTGQLERLAALRLRVGTAQCSPAGLHGDLLNRPLTSP